MHLKLWMAITCLAAFITPLAAQTKPSYLLNDPQLLAAKSERVGYLVDSLLTARRRMMTLDDEGGVLLSRPTYRQNVEHYFTNLAYERGALPSGNSAALELLDKETQLKASIAKKLQGRSGPVIATAGVQAKLNEGIGTLFNGNTAGAGTTFFGNFAFMPRNARYKYVLTTMIPHGPAIPGSWENVSKRRNLFYETFSSRYRELYTIKAGTLIGRLADIEALLQQDVVRRNNEEVLKLINEKNKIQEELKALGLADDSSGKILQQLAAEFDKGLYKAEADDPQWEWFRIFWVAGGLTYVRESYDIYDSLKTINKRFDTKNFDGWGFKLTGNYYKERTKEEGWVRSAYGNISYEPKATNSFAILTGQDITRVISDRLADTVYNYQVAKNAKDVSKVKYNTGWQHSLSTNWTFILGKKENFGLNLFAQVQASALTSPVYNTSVSFLFRMVNNKYDPEDKKSEAKVNFQVFMKFPDMSDVAGDDKSVWQKRVIGVSASVPFNKIFFN